LTALLLLALIAAAPLWIGPGVVNTRAGGDSPFVFIRLHQLVENLRAGVFPARWMPDAAYGLGYPFFNFYAALPYYFAATFNLVGFDVLASIKIVQSLGFVLAALGMYGWAKSVSDNASYAWLAAVAYTFAPFHLVNVYVRGDSLSEFYAFAFYPLILWAIDRVSDRPRPRSVALLALAYGGLILTHNISALIFSPFVLLYLLFRSWRLEAGGWNGQHAPSATRHPFRLSALNILHCSFGIALGLLISMWFWLPALSEAPLVQLDAQTTGYFNYSEHFRSVDLVQPSLGFDYAVEPPRTPFAMGLVQAIATLAGVVALIVTWQRDAGRLRAFALIGLAASTLLITPLSKSVWDALPLLPLAQFPWRFLSVQALFVSVVIGYLAHSAGDRPVLYSVSRIPYPVFRAIVPEAKRSEILFTQYAIHNTSGWAAALGLALTLSAMLTLRPDYLPIRAEEITPERIQLYEAFTTNIGTTIRAEYLPRTTIPRPYTGPALIAPAAPPRAIPIRGEAQAERVARGPISQSWIVHAASQATLALPTLYFPGWQASIDGQPTEARAAADLGYIEVDVPAGEHTLALGFDRTPIRAFAEIVSLGALIGVLGLLLDRRRANDEGRKGVSRIAYRVSRWRYAIGVFALGSVLAVIATSANPVSARDDDLAMDFESKPWLHHSELDFGSVNFTRYRYLAPDDRATFNVGLWWSDYDKAIDPVVSAQLVAPSQPVFGEPEPLASAAKAMSAAPDFFLEIGPRRARGLHYVRVEVEGVGATYLRPVYFPGSPTALESQGWARIGNEIELSAVYLKHDQPNRLTVGFDWVALRPIAANYAVSLRLQDASGRVWASLDTQPGYGFLPTSAWLSGESQPDRYTLALPADMPRDGAYALDVVWYRVASQQEIGRVRVPGIAIGSLYGETRASPPPRNFVAPPMRQRVDATFGGMIELLGYDRAQADNRLSLTLHWQALADIGADYKFFVHVIDPATEQIISQIDARPGDNAYPTSRWVKGEIVSESVELELESRVFRVVTGWYDPISTDRLPAFDAQGDRLSADRVLLDK
jgi:hypothetical protein